MLVPTLERWRWLLVALGAVAGCAVIYSWAGNGWAKDLRNKSANWRSWLYLVVAWVLGIAALESTIIAVIHLAKKI